MPTLNAARHLARSLAPLVPAVADGLVRELVVADGGSTDETASIAEAVGARIVVATQGRAAQLIAGAAAAKSDWLLFLHAETALDDNWAAGAARFIAQPENRLRAAVFRYVRDGDGFDARMASLWIGLLRLGVASPHGDQGLLMSRAFYDSLGGYRDLPVAEDVDLLRRIGRRRLQLLKARAVTLPRDR